jgi:organic radical activating enzyme
MAAHPKVAVSTLAEQARQAQLAGAAFTVITGGEPLHHNLDALCHALDAAPSRLPIHLETSGVDPLSGRFDWITLSPKRHRPPQQQVLAACHELKVVVGDKDDLAFAEAMALATMEAGRPDSSAPPILLLQPLWDSAAGQELAIAHVRQNPRWRLSLQSHKWLGVR